MTSRRLAMTAASIIISAGSLFLILRAAPVADVMNSIQQADPGQLLIAFVFVTLSLFTRGVRWWGLLGWRLPLIQTAHIVNVMFLGNQLPLRMGEVARSLLARRGGVPIVTAAASIVIERLADTLVVVLMIASVVSQLPDAPPEITRSASLFGLLALMGFAALLILARTPALAHRILDRLLTMLPLLRRLPLKTMLDNLLAGLQPLTQIRLLIFSGIWTGIAWAMTLASFYFLHQALGIQVNFAHSVPLGIALTALSIALPVSIAGLGPFEGAVILTGQLVGMDHLAAVSLGFLFHGIAVLGYAVWGVLGLLALGIAPAAAFKIKPHPPADKA